MALDGTFHLAVNGQVFARKNLTLHGHILS
jgi:hypothetical protein